MIKVNNNKFMVLIVKCTASDSHFTEVGGFIQLLQRSDAVIFDSFFSRISAMIGGVIAVSQNSNVQIDKCTFMNNRAGQAGGVFMITDLSSIVGNLLTISKNSAVSGGVFRLSSESVLMLSNSTIDSNYAMESESVGLLLEPQEILFSGVKFTRNGFLSALDFPDSINTEKLNYTAEIAISI